MEKSQVYKPTKNVWVALLWKEWQEQKWKFAGFLLLLLIITLWFSYISSDRIYSLEALAQSFIPYGVLVGLCVGMNLAAGEYQRGTIKFLQQLPVLTKKPALAKLGMAAFVSVAPILMMLLCCTAYYLSAVRPVESRYEYLNQKSQDVGITASEGDEWNQLYETVEPWLDLQSPFNYHAATGFSSWAVGNAICGSSFVLSLLLWMAATGANRSNEIRAAAVGFLSIAAVWFCINLLTEFVFVDEKTPVITPWENFVLLLMAAAPGGVAFVQTFERWGGQFIPDFVPHIIVAIISHGALLVWFLRRYGRAAQRPKFFNPSKQAASTASWLAPPKSSQLSALVWKQLNETGALAILAAATILMISVAAYRLNQHSEHAARISYSQMLVSITMAGGFLVTLVAGMGTFLEDLKPKVNHFRRALPANRTQWFFTNYLTGLSVLVVTFGSLVLIAYFTNTGESLLEKEHPVLQVVFFALAFLLLFSVSVLTYCLGRQPILAVIATIVLLWGGTYGVGVLFGYMTIRPNDWPIPVATLILAILSAIVLAWQTFRNDWGWHK